MDIVESSGVIPARQSASTQAQSVSTSSSLGSVIKAPVASRDAASVGGGPEIGQEIEAYNLLIIDQHSFAGISRFAMFSPLEKHIVKMDFSIFVG